MRDELKEYLPIVILIASAMLAFVGFVKLLETVF